VIRVSNAPSAIPLLKDYTILTNIREYSAM
jgi:hypothetical protein